MIKKFSVFLWIILTLGSCKKTTSPTIPTGVDVYLIGSGAINSSPTSGSAMYWKNNEPVELFSSTISDLGVQEYPTGIAVSGNDVYVSGTGTAGRNAQAELYSIAKYWKNGVPVNLTDGLTIAFTTGIGISGADVIVIGQESTTDLQQAFGKYWKNGVGVILSGAASPTGIAVTGKDVYISGRMHDSLTGHETAVYWKNGTMVRLSDGSSDSQANAIVISGSDIYIAGHDGFHAAYWKNQVPVYLTDGSYPYSARAIAVEGNDVLVAGDIIGTYWKNGIPVTMSENVDISSVALAEGDTYIVGSINRYPMAPYTEYWINNLRQPFFDSTSTSSVSKILVIKH
jgi:hypothetical protein